MRLSELRSLYVDNMFIIGQYNSAYKTVIIPKEVVIKEDLTVWHDGACIINGMHDEDFVHSKNDKNSVKNELVKLIDKDDSLDIKIAKNLKSFNRIKKRL